MNSTTKIIPDSTSLILRSAHIVLVKVESAEAEAWKPLDNGMQERFVNLQLHLDEVLKGDVERPAGAGDRFPLRISQTSRTVSRVFAVPGVWSEKPVDAGSRLVVFSSAKTDGIGAILDTPAVIAVWTADLALLDVKLAMDAENKELSLPRLIQGIGKESRQALYVPFGDYAAARLDEVLFAHPEDFQGLLTFVEDPNLSAVCRTIVYEAIYSRTVNAEKAPQTFPLQLIRCSFRLLRIEQAAGLHPLLLSDYLPALVGLTDDPAAPPRWTPDQVFPAAPPERAQATEALVAMKGNRDAADRIMRWLGSKGN